MNEEQSKLHERIAALSPQKRALLQAKLRATSPGAGQPIVRQSRKGELPLSFAQQRLWFLDQLEPGSPAYNLVAPVALAGILDVPALERSLNEMIQRHEVLHTQFVLRDGQPVQVIVPKRSLVLSVMDLQGLAAHEKEMEAQRIAATDTRFDLAHGPALSATLIRIAREEHVLLVTVHHIAADGWSLLTVFFRELAELYNGFSTNKPVSLPELPIQYADFAVWQREQLQGSLLQEQLSYWRQKLGTDLPLLDLPTDYPRPAVQRYRGDREGKVLPRRLSESLDALSRREGTTLFITLLTAFKLLLSRYTGQHDIVVGTTVAGRERWETQDLVGFFVNALVLRTDTSGSPSYRELLRRVREVYLGAYAHQDLPFEKLVEELQPERRLDRTPLFQVLFNMHNFPGGGTGMRGLAMKSFPSRHERSRYDLELTVRAQREIRMDLFYDTDLFARPRIITMLDQLEELLRQIVVDPEKSVSRYSLATPSSARLLPDPRETQNTRWEGAIQARFVEQARRVPQRAAIVGARDSWSYGELDARSNQLANYLRGNGIGRGDVVAIYAHRSAPLVWALFGVLKAGAAYLILDPAFPAPRLMDYLRIAQPHGWLEIRSAGALPQALEEFVTGSFVCCRLALPPGEMAQNGGDWASYSKEDPGVVVGPNDLAYVAFTSGSTGSPKAVLATHGPMTHFLPWLVRTFDFDETDRFSMLSGLSFNPLQREVFTPLALGAQLCIPDGEDFRSGRLAAWMAGASISVVHLTPAMGQLLHATNKGNTVVPSLRWAVFAGDVLKREDVQRLRMLAPTAGVANFYGATETQRAVGHFVIPPSQPAGQLTATIPLGRGVEDVQLLVLNKSQDLAGVGEVGEIYIRSPHLAKGYLGDEKLTRQRFLANPFTLRSEDRFYRTFELGRFLPDGNVELVGRFGDQVNIRGFRVALGEVERVLRKHPEVFDAVVLASADHAGEPQLVGYVVSPPASRPTPRELRRYMTMALPEHMVPAAYVFMEALPWTPNGKVNRAALPAPARENHELEAAFVAPRTPLELIVAKVWREILGVEQVGAQDNFFDIGGHSLQAARVINRLQDTFGIDFPLRSFFETPTVEGVALALSSQLLNGVEEGFLGRTLGEVRQMPEDEVRRVLASRAESSKTGRNREE